MRPLAEPAHQVVLNGLIEVVPDNQRTILLSWLENIRDWCISRQLWWGHRIPIWHCANCQGMVPALDSRVEIVDGHARAASVPTECPNCGGSELTQDTDVLDTWFSSGLWPFSTLGWPDDTDDLRTFYPTSLLISGYDILFFWDARMIMMGLHLAGASAAGAPREARTIPFRRLYLHSLVRTTEGVKMSKTKGTGIDPLELIEKFGTDALRYMLASMAAPGTDIVLSEDRILGARAFANKIWNAARFLFVNLEKIQGHDLTIEDLAAPEIRAAAPYPVPGDGSLAHRWIFSRLSSTAAQMNEALEHFRFHEACQLVYHFFWGDFCDWYIEWVKPQLAATDRQVALAAWRNIFAALDRALRLLHPVMPFLTEELWHRLPQPAASVSIALDKFPEPNPRWTDETAGKEMATLQEIVNGARNIRAEMKLDAKRKVAASLASDDAGVLELVERNLDPLLRLATLSTLEVSPGRLDSAGAAIRSTVQFDLRIAYGEGVDKQSEIAKLKREAERLAKDIETKQARLRDDTFRSRAPAEIVRSLELTLAERRIEHERLVDRLGKLQ
jgi:valyl-tRNA synthetase